MTDRTPEPLDGAEEKRIVTECEDFGLPVEEVHAVGGTLILSPRRLEDLPDATSLRRLAHNLGDLGYQNVACAVPTSPEDSARRPR